METLFQKQQSLLSRTDLSFKPNFASLASKLEVSRNSLEEYLTFMEDAGLIARLRDSATGIIGLGKVEKVYLDNPNLVYFLSSGEPETGNIRETFFLIGRSQCDDDRFQP